MKTGRPKSELVLSDDERSQLQSFARSRSLSAAGFDEIDGLHKACEGRQRGFFPVVE